MPATNTKSQPAATESVSAASLGLEFDLGSFFLDEDEKNECIDNAQPFWLTAIDYDPENQYGARYVLTVEASNVDEPTRRGWAMAASNAKRNQIIEQIMKIMSQKNLAKVGPIVFERRGRTIMFRPIEDAPATTTAASTDDLGF